MKKLIINLCPTGMITNKNMTPFVPQSPEEIINDVLMCAKFGVSIAHIHACDENNAPTYKKDTYAKIISGIREKRPDLVITVSTSGRLFNEFEQRSEVLELEGDLKPDMASLTLGSLNFMKTASVNSPDMIMRLAGKMLDKGIKPELEVFDTGMMNYANYLISKGLLEPPYYFNVILGNIATAQATLNHLGLIMAEMPDNSTFSIGGIGKYQKDMNLIGVILANGVRVGLEDNIWFDDAKSIFATNYTLIERVSKSAALAERPIALPYEVREMLKLPCAVKS